jgi:hypothetical protein
MAADNRLWGQRRIQAELSRVQIFSQTGRQVYATNPSSRAVLHVRSFLRENGSEI